MKACISLSLVMGITWIVGVLVIEVEELFVLAYIFTIFVAFQGLFIFITFVLISESKRVKELYRKWWKGKVAESDFLSKHFGEKTLTSTLVSKTSCDYIIVAIKIPVSLTLFSVCRTLNTMSQKCLLFRVRKVFWPQNKSLIWKTVHHKQM